MLKNTHGAKGGDVTTSVMVNFFSSRCITLEEGGDSGWMSISVRLALLFVVVLRWLLSGYVIFASVICSLT